jgi:acyl dehydratase
MATRELHRSPRMPALYARAAASMVPGAARLPHVPGGGGEIPSHELVLGDVRIDPGRLAAYARTCGFGVRDHVPATYLHVLAFPLHMALMADGRFPFGAVGLVHVANRIVQHRPIGRGEALELRVRATPLEAHARGRAFTILSTARSGGELVWEDASTILRRERAATGPAPAAPGAAVARDGASPGADPAPIARWRLPAGLGRRYAAVSGDRNPIHLHDAAAKLLGFPRTIAHGMWTKARCLAALEPRVPESFSVEARFRKPVLLPSTVTFGAESGEDGTRFAVRAARDGTPHLDGRVAPR